MMGASFALPQLLFLLLSVTFWLLGRGEKNSGVEKVCCSAF